MKLLITSFKFLYRSKNRMFLTVGSVLVAMLLFFNLTGLREGYTRSIQRNINQLGAHLLAIPKGCPYEATALVLYGGILPGSLPGSMLDEFETMDNVERFYGFMMGMIPSPDLDDKSDILYGVTDEIFNMKPDWDIEINTFEDDYAVVLGHHKAMERRVGVGDKIGVGHQGNQYRVKAVLPELGVEDDHLIFMPLHMAQRELESGDILAGVAVVLNDLQRIDETSVLIERLPDVQVVTMTQVIAAVMSFLDMIQAFLIGILIITLFASALQLLNTIYMSILEQIKEIGIMKAIGATNGHLAMLIIYQSMIMALMGNFLAIGLSFLLRPWVEQIFARYVPAGPTGSLLYFNPITLLWGTALVIIISLLASIYPIFRTASLTPVAIMSMEESV